MAIISQILSIFILGLIGGANPGPLLISCCSESFRLGFAKSFKTILWGLISESIVGIIIFAIIFSLNPPKQIFYAVALAGGIFLSYIAWQVGHIDSLGDKGAPVFTFKKIFILTLLNGSFWLFFITICAPFAYETGKIIPAGQWFFLIIFELGWLIATAAIVFLFSRFREVLIKKNAVKTVYIIMALVLFYFAARMIIINSFNLWNLYA